MKPFALVRNVAISLSLLVVGASVVQAAPPTMCTGTGDLVGEHGDVIVKATDCTLKAGATVFGSVFVSMGRDLTAEATSKVFGSIQVDGGGDIYLMGKVLGDVTVKNVSGNVTVDPPGSVGKVVLHDSGKVTVTGTAGGMRGTVAAILSTRSMGVTLNGGRVFPGGVTMVQSKASLNICGSEIGIDSDAGTDGSGGVTVVESGPPTTAVPVHVIANEMVCGAASQIEGTVIVTKGTGDVKFLGQTLLPGDVPAMKLTDLIVVEQSGEVVVEVTSLSDVKVEKITGVGNVTLDSVTTDSDTSIADILGNAMIKSSTIPSTIVGDIQIKAVGALVEVPAAGSGVFVRNGDVTLDHVTASDLSIVDTRDVTIGSCAMGSTLGGDLEIKLARDVTLDDLTSPSDTSITGNRNVLIKLSALSGDLKITSNVASDPADPAVVPRGVTVMGNNFFLEDISISKNKGPINVADNDDLSLSIIDNNGVEGADKVEVTNNTFTDAEVSKNTVYSDIDITDNTGETLHCSDNVPVPDLSGNTIPVRTGECAAP